jgi:hypothetical protein
MTMPSEAARNLVHGLLLAVWVAVGILVARTGTPLGALLVHGGLLLALALVPRVFPLSLLRAGLDVLGKT